MKLFGPFFPPSTKHRNWNNPLTFYSALHRELYFNRFKNVIPLKYSSLLEQRNNNFKFKFAFAILSRTMPFSPEFHCRTNLGMNLSPLFHSYVLYKSRYTLFIHKADLLQQNYRCWSIFVECCILRSRMFSIQGYFNILMIKVILLVRILPLKVIYHKASTVLYSSSINECLMK